MMNSAARHKPPPRWPAKALYMRWAAVALLYLGLPAFAMPAPAADAEVRRSFDPRMFKGTGISPHLIEQFNAISDIPPGTYPFDVYLNEKLKFRRSLELRSHSGGQPWICVDNEFLRALELPAVVPEGASCSALTSLFAGATDDVDGKKLRYRIAMPQSHILQPARGQVLPEDLDAGITALSISYLGNYQVVQTTSGPPRTTQSGHLTTNAGLNLGQWQLRQQGSFQYQSGHGLRYHTTRSYLQRPLLSWGSELLVGQIFTSGRHFSTLGFTGVQLRTDERMLPDALRGFAPEVHGVAQTNAKVTVRQNGHQIYQMTVAPGRFAIRDLYPTSLAGDLEVEVEENDGRVRSFTVPFSAVPDSLRPASSRYELALGRTHGEGDDAWFTDAVYSRGFSNTLTGTGGLRMSRNYLAALLGSVWNAPLGALGGEFTYVSTQPDFESSLAGWRAQLSYSRKFSATGSVVTLAGYRYSSDAYRDLNDVIGLRAGNSSAWLSSSFQQRERLNINVHQPLGDWGAFYLSASRSSYRDGRPDNQQLQLGFSKSFSSGVSMNLAVTRQTLTSSSPGSLSPAGNLQSHAQENTAMISASIPLESTSSRNAHSLSLASTHSKASGTHLQATYAGMAHPDHSLSYSLTATHATESNSTGTLAANVQKRFAKATFGASAARGSGFWQAGASAQGAMVLHAGGVTLGPYISDTAALVEAPGAEGARIWGGPIAKVDANGYALVPSVSPYRYNRVTLDTDGMNGDVELLSSEQRVAPYSGALVKLRYETRGGQALLIRALTPEHVRIPMGADVFNGDDESNAISMVGQNQQIYLRVEAPKGRLQIHWGDAPHERCALEYATDMPGATQLPGMTVLEAWCR